MISTIISATWYADLALIVLLLLFVLMGVLRGLGRSMKGFFMAIFIILGSLLLVGALHNTVMTSSLGGDLNAKLSEVSTNWGDAFNKEISVQEDGSFTVNINGEDVALSSVDGLKGKIANSLASRFISAETEGESLASVCVYNLTSLIVAICLFVVLCIGLSIVAALLRGLTKGMHDSSSGMVKIVDRTFGGLVGLILGATFIFLIFAILTSFEDKVPAIMEYINESEICKFFYDLNPIGTMFRKIFLRQG